jgi:hypothetical protein
MEARWCVEFIGVVLAGGAELTTSVDKAAAGLMEKASERRGGEGGTVRGRQAEGMAEHSHDTAVSIFRNYGGWRGVDRKAF